MSGPLESLIDDICSPDPVAVAAALQTVSPHRDLLAPVLLARLLQAAAEPSRWTGTGGRPSPVFLCYLAAEWKLTEAHPLIVALLRLPFAQSDAVLGDLITEGGRLVLADTWPGNSAAITALALDSAAEPFARGAALGAAALLTSRGIVPRADALQLLQQSAALPLDSDSEDDVAFATEIVSTILDLKARELEPVAAALFDRDLIDPSMCGDRDEVLRELAAPGDPDPTDAFRFPPPVTSAWETVRHWHFFNGPAEDEEAQAEDVPPPAADFSSYREPVTIRRPTPKIGRNDPCPCGSGKKYKKCCGA